MTRRGVAWRASEAACEAPRHYMAGLPSGSIVPGLVGRWVETATRADQISAHISGRFSRLPGVAFVLTETVPVRLWLFGFSQWEVRGG